jgi:tRNA A37 threonylcarbamoyladenosine dehydratase
MYEEAKTVYMNSFDPVYTMERSELKSEVFSLREKVNDLYSQIEESRRERKDANAESTRMEGIMKLVSQRTPMGSEKEVERKLTTWFNGLY